LSASTRDDVAFASRVGGSLARPLRVGRRRWFPVVLALSLAVTLAFLVFPVLAIFLRTSPGELISSLSNPASLDALRLSIETTTIGVIVIVLVGTPAAYMLATRSFQAKALVVTLIELPLVMPPAVAGIGLLVAFGPKGLLGGLFSNLHIELVLQTAGVVIALVFVAAPFYLRLAQSAFAAVDRSLTEASRTLGVSEAATFIRVSIPVALPGLAAGVALAWGRELGEFGATLMFAGSYQGITQTAPLAIYSFVGTDLNAALALSAVLVIVSAVLLLTVKLVTGTTVLSFASR
jgi:molybdate transport system permease protein